MCTSSTLPHLRLHLAVSLEAQWTYLNGVIIMALAGANGASFLLGRLTSQTTMSVSNMLGPVESVSLGGNPITAITPTAPPPNHVSSKQAVAVCLDALLDRSLVFAAHSGTVQASDSLGDWNIASPEQHAVTVR